MSFYRHIFAVLCVLCLWLAASSGAARTLATTTVHHHQHHSANIGTRADNTALFLTLAPDSFGELCEETEETENDDALESELTSVLLSVPTLEPASTLPSAPLCGRCTLALYILHHNWKHFLA